MHLLTFEITSDGEELMIHGDVEGLRFLREEVDRLINNTNEGSFDHAHLMTEAWAGTELSSESQGDRLINHVKIYCWKNK
jgi:hypothetical protein